MNGMHANVEVVDVEVAVVVCIVVVCGVVDNGEIDDRSASVCGVITVVMEGEAVVEVVVVVM